MKQKYLVHYHIVGYVNKIQIPLNRWECSIPGVWIPGFNSYDKLTYLNSLTSSGARMIVLKVYFCI